MGEQGNTPPPLPRPGGLADEMQEQKLDASLPGRHPASQTKTSSMMVRLFFTCVRYQTYFIYQPSICTEMYI
jgi:hypothetical protein